jgi:enoyl-CoA hydratase
MTDAPGSPQYRLDDGVAVITLDDGRANAISVALLDQLHGVLDRAEEEARAVVIVGREGRFCAGFDLAAMTESAESMRTLVIAGARFLARLYGHSQPTVAACTGHALAAGALVLLACDTRIGADGAYKLGLNEVGIGMALPVFAVELARDRLSPAAFSAATIQARIYDPPGAVAAGYLDRTGPAGAVIDQAVAEARRLGELRGGAYARTKFVARQAVIDRILATLEDDIASVTGPPA